MAGVTKSGQYWIDPDGPTGQIPAELRVCEFAPNSLTRIPGDPTTIIGTGVASKIRSLMGWFIFDKAYKSYHLYTG